MSESIDVLCQRCVAALNRLAKWRSVFAGWQLGTRPKTDPECQAVRDQRELLMFLRAESSALRNLLVKKGIFTESEWFEALEVEARELDKSFEALFPGMRATDEGITIFDPGLAHETTKGWKP